MLIVTHVPVLAAQESATPIGENLPAGVTLDFSAQGILPESPASGSHLVVERITLDQGETLPSEPGPQIIVNESGNLETVNDLGLTATLAEGEHYFDSDGSDSDLRATEPVSVLRARISKATDQTTPPAQEQGTHITITDDGCAPSEITLGPDRAFTIENQTDNPQQVSFRSLDIDATIRPNHTETIDLTGEAAGNWIMDCPYAYPIGSASDPIMVVVPSEEKSPPAAAPPIVLFDLPISGYASPPASFFFARAVVPAHASLGSIELSGFTAVYADTQSLSIARSGYLTSTLPAGTGAGFSDTTVEIRNTGSGSTGVYLAGFARSRLTGESITPSDTSSDNDDDRPTTRDDAPPTPTPGIDPRDNSGNAIDQLAGFLPDHAGMAELGFPYLSSWRALDYESIWISSYDLDLAPGTWVASLVGNYGTIGSDVAITINVDLFEKPSDAARMLKLVELGASANGPDAEAPALNGADTTLAMSRDYPDFDGSYAYIFAQFGNIIVTIIHQTALYDDPLPGALDVWDLVSIP